MTSCATNNLKGWLANAPGPLGLMHKNVFKKLL